MDGVTAVEFARAVSLETGLTVIVQEELDQRPVSVEVVNQPVSRVLAIVARRLGVQVTRTDDMFYLGDLRPEDRGVMVKRGYRLKGPALEGACRALLSGDGRVLVETDGLIVVSDRVEVLSRIDEMLGRLEAVGPSTWVVQMYLVSVSDDASHDLGFDVVPALEIASVAAAASGSGALGAVLPAAGSSVSVSGGLSAILRASQSREGVSVLSEPLVLLVDGQKAEWARGNRIGVVRRTVSDQGTVTGTGLDFIQVGLTLSAGIREVSEGMGRLEFDLEMSELLSQNELGAPNIRNDSLKGSCDVASGGTYLAGSLRRAEQRQVKSTMLKLGDASTVSEATLQLWVRAYRVDVGRFASARLPKEPSGSEPAQFTDEPKKSLDGQGPSL